MKNYWIIAGSLSLGLAIGNMMQNSVLKSIKNGEKQDFDRLIKENNNKAIWLGVGGILVLLGGIYGFKK